MTTVGGMAGCGIDVVDVGVSDVDSACSVVNGVDVDDVIVVVCVDMHGVCLCWCCHNVSCCVW